MTEPQRRISISLPQDVAEVLAGVPNASAYITESVRLRRRRESTRAMIAEAGYLLTEPGLQAMRFKLAYLDHLREGGQE